MLSRSLMIFVLLFSVILHGQSNESFDFYFYEGSAAFSPTSIEEFSLLLSSENVKFAVFQIEVFPFLGKELVNERLVKIQEVLKANEIEVEKITFFDKKEHLYFDRNFIDGWNFIRIRYKQKVIPISTNQALSVERESGEANIIAGDASHTLYLGKGSIIKIPKNCFIDKAGEIVEGEVSIQTVEILTSEDAILNGITTNYEAGYLESRGMISIEAFDETGQRLELAKDKEIAIFIPETDSLGIEGFQIFEGKEKDDSYDWEVISNEMTSSSRPAFNLFVWKKISKTERQLIKEERAKILGKWKDDKRLRRFSKLKRGRCRKAYKRKHLKNRSKRFLRTKSNRDFEKLSKGMIIANAKYKWYRDTLDETFSMRYTQFSIGRLGMFNIDRIIRLREVPTKDIVVNNENKRKIKILFRNQFIFIDGQDLNGKTMFKNIPINKEIVLIGSKIEEDGGVELGFQFANTREKKFDIDNFESYSIGDYEMKVRELCLKESN